MAAHYQTFCIKKHGVNVATFCAFKKEAFRLGEHWDVHKGRLQMAHDSVPTKVIVKVYPDPKKSHQECEAEVRKMDFVEDVLKNNPESGRFKVSRTYKAEVDEACAMCSFKLSRKPGGPIGEGTPVIVQDRTEGVIQALDIEDILVTSEETPTAAASSDDEISTASRSFEQISLAVGSSSSTSVRSAPCRAISERNRATRRASYRRRSRSEGSVSCVDSDSHHLLLNLASASYNFSHGTKVIAGIKVVKLPSSRKVRHYGDSRSATCILTSVTVHSTTQEFGCKDRGNEGIREFLQIMKRTGRLELMQDGTRRREPSAPPLENDDAFQNCLRQCSVPAGIPMHTGQVFCPKTNFSPSQALPLAHAHTPELMTHNSENGDDPSSRMPVGSQTGDVHTKQMTRRTAESADRTKKLTTKNADFGDNLLRMMMNRSNSVDKTRFNPFCPTAPSIQPSGEHVEAQWANFADFYFPPAYESVMCGHEREDAPPPYAETIGDQTFNV